MIEKLKVDGFGKLSPHTRPPNSLARDAKEEASTVNLHLQQRSKGKSFYLKQF